PQRAGRHFRIGPPTGVGVELHLALCESDRSRRAHGRGGGTFAFEGKNQSPWSRPRAWGGTKKRPRTWRKLEESRPRAWGWNCPLTMLTGLLSVRPRGRGWNILPLPAPSSPRLRRTARLVGKGRRAAGQDVLILGVEDRQPQLEALAISFNSFHAADGIEAWGVRVHLPRWIRPCFFCLLLSTSSFSLFVCLSEI